MNCSQLVLLKAELFKHSKILQALDLRDVVIEELELSQINERLKVSNLTDLLMVENDLFYLALPSCRVINADSGCCSLESRSI